MNPDKLDTAVTITDEMVERAVDAYANFTGYRVSRKGMRAALAASLPSTGAGMVRGLEWEQNGRAEGSIWAKNDHINRFYTIEPTSNVFEVDTGMFMSEAGRDSLGLHPTLEAAKAAAQADYERRILAALEPVAVAAEASRTRRPQAGGIEVDARPA